MQQQAAICENHFLGVQRRSQRIFRRCFVRLYVILQRVCPCACYSPAPVAVAVAVALAVAVTVTLTVTLTVYVYVLRACAQVSHFMMARPVL